jgi:NDP-sugar pyrophosphorylase family protein
VFVRGPFDPSIVRDCFFSGRVRIGGTLRYHDYTLPVGITHSRVISCDIGDNCAIHDCRYVSHYIIGDGVILSCVDEMDTTNHVKFGEGARQGRRRRGGARLD